jgi:5'-methylthioadenosine phosphorylase
VPYRANIYALKTLGVRYIVSVSAVGSLQENLKPLDMVVPDQMIDMTKQRVSTFFGDGAVAHVSMADPLCPALADILARAYDNADISEGQCHPQAAYVCIEGPQFSTRAESHWYRQMQADIIGMTNMPEAKLAREASIAYTTLALVTDFDCWHPHGGAVSADYAIQNLMKNAENALGYKQFSFTVQSILDRYVLNQYQSKYWKYQKINKNSQNRVYGLNVFTINVNSS